MAPKLLLDQHISFKVAKGLRREGFDVVALQEMEKDVQTFPDDKILKLATKENRAIVTYNVRDFLLLHKIWLSQNRSHSGIVLIHSKTIPQSDISLQISSLKRFLETRSENSLRGRIYWIRKK